MRLVPFLICFLFTCLLVFLLNNRWVVGGVAVPPLGKFLSPTHGFWQNMQRDHMQEETLLIPGLEQPVTVVFDSLMIPHVYAASDADVYLAQGFLTARDRLWQMEFQVLAGAGRLSEFLGFNPDILAYDREQRRLGMTFGARNALNEMMKDSLTRRCLDRYTEGVNLYIQSLPERKLPFEYKLLDYKPEPWTNLKIAMLLKNMCKTLNMGDKDFEMTSALKLFGPEMVELLYPDNEHSGDPIVDAPGKWNFAPAAIPSTPLAIPPDFIKVKHPKSDPHAGSNNWAVSGTKTATGAPILCGDPHLNLTLPSIWYVMHLHTPDMNVMGAAIPGAPTVIIGFNDSIAWSVTNAQRDLVDWFSIQYQDSQRHAYWLDGKWIETKKVVEKIHIRGEDTFYDTVVYTHWGPVTYDKSFPGNSPREEQSSGMSFRWIAHDPSNELKATYQLNRAQNFSDYMSALNHWKLPAQNFAFASVQGDIAMRVQGAFPIRRPGEGKFVIDGSVGTNGWNAFIPNEQNMYYKNPSRGFVSSANQYPVDDTYPYYITASNYETYRNRRINEVLRELDSVTVRDMMRLQNDNLNLKARENLPWLLAQLDSSNQDPAAAILRDWNFENNADSEGASYFSAWWDALLETAWDEMTSATQSLEMPTDFVTSRLLREQPGFQFFDVVGTPKVETARDVARIAFDSAVHRISAWKERTGNTHVYWGEYKASFISHLVPTLRVLGQPVNTGGGGGIVNAHNRRNGPSWKMIVSLEPNGVRAWGIYPGGQSGNVGSKFYNNMIDRYVQGGYYSLHFPSQPDTSIQLTSLQMLPSKK